MAKKVSGREGFDEDKGSGRDGFDDDDKGSGDSSDLHVRLLLGTTPGYELLQQQDNQKEQQPDCNGTHYVGPRPGIGRIRRGGRDPRPQTVLQSTEVLADDGSNDSIRSSNPQPGEDVWHRGRETNDPRELPAADRIRQIGRSHV